jgi:hypothetical protein
MEKYQCLVCHKEMEIYHRIKFIDHSCVSKDHNFSWRIQDGQLIKLRIRFLNDKERLCLKVHYDDKYSEVWGQTGSARIRLDQIIIPDFENIEILKNKLRTILVFH